MTHTYSAKPAPFQLDFAAIAASWRTKSKVWADSYLNHRARRRNIAALRALSPEILDDIGVDAAELNATPPSIARLNPYVIAFAGFRGQRYFQVWR